MDILANEARCVYKKRRMNLPEKDTEFPKVARRKSLEKWQQHWDGSQKGQWVQGFSDETAKLTDT